LGFGRPRIYKLKGGGAQRYEVNLELTNKVDTYEAPVFAPDLI
jgi:hypothetical protein